MSYYNQKEYFDLRVGDVIISFPNEKVYEVAMGKYRNVVLVLDYIAKEKPLRDTKGRFISIPDIKENNL